MAEIISYLLAAVSSGPDGSAAAAEMALLMLRAITRAVHAATIAIPILSVGLVLTGYRHGWPSPFAKGPVQDRRDKATNSASDAAEVSLQRTSIERSKSEESDAPHRDVEACLAPR